MIRHRKWALAALTVAAGLLLAPAAAQALPGGNWASSSDPLVVKTSSGIPIGYAYGTWQGVREDQGRGTRMQDWSAHRDPANTNERGAYVPHHWWFNKNSCYITSFSDSGGSIGCSEGWWKTGTTETPRAKLSWAYYETWKGLDPAGSSGRGQMYVCHDYAWATDPCSSGYYLRGNDY